MMTLGLNGLNRSVHHITDTTASY